MIAIQWRIRLAPRDRYYYHCLSLLLVWLMLLTLLALVLMLLSLLVRLVVAAVDAADDAVVDVVGFDALVLGWTMMDLRVYYCTGW